MKTSDVIENRTFDEIAIGESASLSRTLSKDDIALFAVMSGDVNPAHLDQSYAEASMFHHIIGHGMWGGSLISAVLGTRLPGPGTIYLGQDLRFRKPVGVGDTITVTVTAKEKRPEKRVVVFDCRCVNQKGEEVITGTAVTMAPADKIRRPRVVLPEVQLLRHDRYAEFVTRCAKLGAIPTAVVHPCDRLRSKALSAPQRLASSRRSSSAPEPRSDRSRPPKASISSPTKSWRPSTATPPRPPPSPLRAPAKSKH